MYKINVYDVEADGSLTKHEESNRRYMYVDDAKKDMYQAMIEGLNELVKISHEKELFCNAFTINMDAVFNGKKYDGVIKLWNIPADIMGEPFALYEIEWVNECPEDEFNKMLKDTYGDSITLIIRSEMDEDEDEEGEWAEVEKYYFEGSRCPKSELYSDPKKAYDMANEYMANIELYADLD